MSEQLPHGCAPFDIQRVYNGHRTTCAMYPAQYLGIDGSLGPKSHRFTGDGHEWWVNDEGKCIKPPKGALFARDFDVYMVADRLSELKPPVGQDVRMEPKVHGAFHPTPEPPITATLWLGAEGKRKITVTSPLSVTKAELARIQAWIALLLLVEGE